jgi:hypothetical protein
MGNTTTKFKLHLAEQFLNSFATNNVWLFVGRPTAWPTVGTPDTFSDTFTNEIGNWDDLMAVQRVSDVSFVIPNNIISSSSSFTEYTDDADIFDSASTDNFFGISSTYRNVYKCISNNMGSTVGDVPQDEQTAVLKTSDGYVWKFMYHISRSDWEKFQVPVGNSIGGWIPVKNVRVDDDSSQWDDAMKGAVDGEIQHVTTTGSTTFADISSSIFVGKAGDTVLINKDLTGVGYGSGFTATIKKHSAGNYYVDITDGGSGYRLISTIHSYDTSTYTDMSTHLRPILSPIGGHGFDSVSELGGFRVMVSVDLTETMAEFIEENEYRKVGLLIDPYTADSSLDTISSDVYLPGNKYTGSVNARQLVKVEVTSGTWSQISSEAAAMDIEFTQLDSGGNVTVNKGKVVEIHNTAANPYTLFLLPTAGEFGTSIVTYPQIRGTLSGASSVTTVSVSKYTQPRLKKYTGKIIYVDNIEAVDRSSSTQLIKLVIEF